jgi:hypothetical protein
VRETKVEESEIYSTLVKKTKNTMPDGELVTAGYISVVHACKLCIKSSGRPQCYFRFGGPGG